MDFTFRKGFTFTAGVLLAYGIYELLHFGVVLLITRYFYQAFLG